MPAGRPTKYTETLLDKAYEYINDGWRFDESGEMNQIPSHVGLALNLDITRETLYSWAKDEDKKEFSDILDKIMSVQQKVLIDNGLTGAFNSTITKLVLGKHGFTEKQQIEHAGGLEIVGDILSKK